jgi:hypothetical protein
LDIICVRHRGRLIKALIYSFIALLVGFIVWRVYFSTIPPKGITRLSVNDALAGAFEKRGGDLELFRQEQPGTTQTKENYGYFTVVDYVIIPEAGQVQVLIRYNKSMPRHVYEDFELDRIPEATPELFDFTLVKTVDLTPDDKKDNNDPDFLDEVRLTPTTIISDTTILYNYRRVVFDDVYTVDAVGLFLDIYYVGRADYDTSPYGIICLYSETSENIPVPLDTADKKALEAAIK